MRVADVYRYHAGCRRGSVPHWLLTWLGATLDADVAASTRTMTCPYIYILEYDMSLYNWSTWCYLVGPRGVILLVHMVLSGEVHVAIWLVHMALSGWSTWCDLVGPRGTIWLVHVACSSWSTRRVLVGPRGATRMFHVSLSGWSTCRLLIGPRVAFSLVHMGSWEYNMLLFLVTTRGCFWWCHVPIFLLGHVYT
jgi:hypothetical protein